VRKLNKIVVLLMLGMAAAFQALGQSPAGSKTAAPVAASHEAGAASKLTFDAASVRPSSRKYVGIGMDFLDPVSDEAPPKGGLFSWNVPFISLVDFAYDLRSPQVRGSVRGSLPKWAQEEWYTVEARAEGNPTRAEVRQMVRSLLEERFQFSGHAVTREGQVYALVVTKPGLGLKPHTEGAPCTLPLPQSKIDEYPHTYPSYSSYAAHCGVFNRELSRNERRLEMLNVTMQQIADSIGGDLPLPVVDRSGLAGRYDAVLDFGLEMVAAPSAGASDEWAGEPLPLALEKQLGLKLVKQKAQVDVFVIEHIAMPSEN